MIQIPNANLTFILSNAYHNKARIIRYKAPNGKILEISEIFVICTQSTGSPILYILTRYMRTRWMNTAYNVNLPDNDAIFKMYLSTGLTLERIFKKPLRTKFLTIGLNSLVAECTLTIHINCSLENMSGQERSYELAKRF